MLCFAATVRCPHYDCLIPFRLTARDKAEADELLSGPRMCEGSAQTTAGRSVG